MLRLWLLPAVVALAACDPAPGSEIDCVPGAAPGGIDDDVPPTEPAALQAWLAAGGYAGFLAESAPHASAGPLGGPVRTLVNARLAGSLATCASPHPVGSVSVKELHDGETPSGWAVMIKAEAPLGADHWYWYEVFSVDPDAEATHAGLGVATCTGCHDAGLDAVRTPWPLQ
jgi:hypothetical protein